MGSVQRGVVHGSNSEGPGGNRANNGFLPLGGGSPTVNPANMPEWAAIKSKRLVPARPSGAARSTPRTRIDSRRRCPDAAAGIGDRARQRRRAGQSVPARRVAGDDRRPDRGRGEGEVRDPRGSICQLGGNLPIFIECVKVVALHLRLSLSCTPFDRGVIRLRRANHFPQMGDQLSGDISIRHCQTITCKPRPNLDRLAALRPWLDQA